MAKSFLFAALDFGDVSNHSRLNLGDADSFSELDSFYHSALSAHSKFDCAARNGVPIWEEIERPDDILKAHTDWLAYLDSDPN